MLSHQRGLYKTTLYRDLFEFVDGFSVEGYGFSDSDTASAKFKKVDLTRLADMCIEYSMIFKRATTVFATANDEARLRRLYEDISEFIDNRPELLI